MSAVSRKDNHFMNEPLNENSEAMQKLRIAVVGGGPGGYAAAFLAADLGMQVTLIDPETNPGGVCLYRGCIPSKALLHVAKLIEESQQAKNWGIAFPEPKIDLTRLRSWKESVVKKLTGGLGQLSKQRRVEYIQGRAAFENSTTLRITRADATEIPLSFDRIILATGSRPAIIPAFKLDSPRLMDSTGALNLEDIPGSLLVVGGGYIGLELGSVYAALGTRVTVVEMLPGLLPGADRDLVLPLHKRLEKMFEAILLNTTVASLKEEGAGIRATFEGAAITSNRRPSYLRHRRRGRRAHARAQGFARGTRCRRNHRRTQSRLRACRDSCRCLHRPGSCLVRFNRDSGGKRKSRDQSGEVSLGRIRPCRHTGPSRGND